MPTNPILLNLPDHLETSRLHMRVPRAGDGAQVYAAVCESLPALRQFTASLPWVVGEQSEENSEIYCRSAFANFQARRDFPFLLFERGTENFIGCAGLHRPDWHTPKMDIGFWCRSSRSKQGYISEAVQALLAMGFDQLGLARIEIITDELNASARKVAEKAGLQLEGILRNERRAHDGVLRNTCVYAATPNK